MSYFTKRTLRKSGPRSFEKRGPYTKIHCICQKNIFQFDKFEDVENLTIIFQTQSLKYPNKAFLVPNLIFVILHNFLHYCKTQDGDSKHHNLFFFSILNPKIRIFIFARNVFKLTTQNYTNKALLVPKLKLFMLNDLPFHKCEGADSKNKNFLKILV